MALRARRWGDRDTCVCPRTDGSESRPYLRAARARSATSQLQVARVTLLETTRDKVGVEIQREDEGKEAGADRDEKDAGQSKEDDADGAEAMGTG